jgi:NAD(P)H-hydrate epimerase
MKLFTTSQIALLDRYTIENEPISDIDLMERASGQITDWILSKYNNDQNVAVFAGPGNNGGDAIAVSRLLSSAGYKVHFFIPEIGNGLSNSAEINLKRLQEQGLAIISRFKETDFLPYLTPFNLIIDGLFGSGLSRPLTGFSSIIVKYINDSGLKIISIDIPSGLMGEDNSANDYNSIIKADYTLTLQFPKLSFFFKENEPFVGEWEVLPIGLHPEGIRKTGTSWNLITRETVQAIRKQRNKFSHKGTYGHALLISGSTGKTGAAVLAAKACLRSGPGLVTVHLPQSGIPIMQTALPEAMVNPDPSTDWISQIPDLEHYQSIGIGPGLGKESETQAAVYDLLLKSNRPLVIDADGLNILSLNKDWLDILPQNSILTPHPLEFTRLSEKASNSYALLIQAIDFAMLHKIYLILKGAYTAICCPDGSCWFNPTGNPGMATGGSGDVLTGILTGLLAQGYSPLEASLLGVYIHGLTADLLIPSTSMESLLAGDIADNLGLAFSSL